MCQGYWCGLELLILIVALAGDGMGVCILGKHCFSICLKLGIPAAAAVVVAVAGIMLMIVLFVLQ